MPNETTVAFHSGSNYYYHFLVKELANEFEGQFEENRENYKTFSILKEKEIRKNDKDGNENIITISYKIKFTDSARLMASS